ncbi:MAG: protein-L-isoaspartate(D-aspartate) O-methyltransferase [Deltaproteobacteria bacterium]|nr:MAG: protein-L-isoaspartate(D-aspartate) O-methyltransferase [Deltaproteobacteria bacterium]
MLTGMAATCRAGSNGNWQAQREKLVRLLRKEITDTRVLAAIGRVPRHLFVPDKWRAKAYQNNPLPIGSGQTISQPFIVAYMTQALGLKGGEKVLEIGTGSGYQAAVLAECGARVFSVEILPELSKRAGETLRKLGYESVRLRIGDGFYGWPEHAPYDGILVTAAAPHVPKPLEEQLVEGGKLVIPIDTGVGQYLKTFVKHEGRLVDIDSLAVRFVPMTGEIQKK